MTFCQQCGGTLWPMGSRDTFNTKHEYACLKCRILFTVRVNSISGKALDTSNRKLSDDEVVAIEAERAAFLAQHTQS